MKKIFTFIFACFLLTGTLPLAAQGDAKTEKEGVMSLVFDQLKQQFGIDFKALANPQLNAETLLKSSYNKQSALRADSKTLTIRPDSAVIDIEDITATNFGTIDEIRLYFEDYALYKVPALLVGILPGIQDDASVEILLPETVRVEGGFLKELDVKLLFEQTGPLHSTFGKIDVSVSLNIPGVGVQTLDLMTFELESFEGSESIMGGFAFTANLDEIRAFTNTAIGKALLGDNAIVPDYNTLITAKTEILKGTVTLNTYATTTTPATSVPTGKSVITLDPASRIYIDNVAQTIFTDGAETGWFKMKYSYVDDTELTVCADIYAFASAAMEGDGTYAGSTIYTMSNFVKNPPVTTGGAIMAAIDAAVTKLAATDPVLYEMVIDSASVTKDTTTLRVIGVKAYIEGDNAIGEVITDNYASGIAVYQTLVKATASKKTNEIIVQNYAADVLQSTFYFNSNVMNYLGMGTEQVVENAGIYVVVTDNGLTLKGIDKGTYSVVDMRGVKLAEGVISGNYIQTPFLNKGIYVLLVKDGSKTKAIKFAK